MVERTESPHGVEIPGGTKAELNPWGLSEREQQVLPLLAGGLKNKQIAAILNIENNTVRAHVRNLMSKMDTKSRAESAVMHNRLQQSREGSVDDTSATETTVFSQLTSRQQQVLDCLIEGLSNKEIGERLKRSERSAKRHVSKIIKILGVKNRIQAAQEHTKKMSPDFIETQDHRKAPNLSSREKQVLELVAEGLLNKEIAFKLNISENTIKQHLNKGLLKLRANNKTQVAVRFIQIQPLESINISHDQEERIERMSFLNPQELEVLELVAQGKSNQEIDNELKLNRYEAKTHVSEIFSKLRVVNRTEAAITWALFEKIKEKQEKEYLKNFGEVIVFNQEH